ncbi:e3 sumo-protein ligase nse2 [Malassezia pachydermatis]|uniref:E3 sumo-protein ligase nse2 n=1 Tax=Malassezia pachydermatis TaxID=77020 RepID=A0A0M9VNT5_9BASI|nr:e3 sumo-protein ligase nse2 [Malassezia pachydermatis]KOS13715.1 e3 sumo-protein ligase nse2 [Malassezia pachydermatis]
MSGTDERTIEAGLAPRLRQMIVQHKNVMTQIQAHLNLLPDMAADLEEYEGERHRVAKLDQSARALLDLMHESECRERTLDMLQSSIAQGTASTDLVDVYKQHVGDQLDTYEARTSRQKYARNAHYIDFRSREVNGDGAMPPLVDLIPAEPGDEQDTAQDEDDDIVVGGTVLQYRCPLTASLLQDPVINTKCQHAYSRDAIHTYIRDQGHTGLQVACPAAGCRQWVSMTSLRDAPDLQRRVDRGVVLSILLRF